MHSKTDHTQFPVLQRNAQTRASLLERVRDWSDDASWREFFATYSVFVYSMALKAGLTETQAEDAVQGTMMSVASSIRDGQYKREMGSFKQWMSTKATWQIQEQLRQSRRDLRMIQKRKRTATGDRTGTIQRLPDERNNLELFFEQDWNDAVAATALARVKTKVKPKHFQMFDLYAVKQWPLRRISRTLGVNVAQVYLVKSRISLMLKQETKQVKAQLESLPDTVNFKENQNK